MRKLAGPLLAAAVGCAALAGPAAAETVDGAYRTALAHYFAGRYDKAIAELERIVALPMHHEDVFYNLGCAYFRKGQLGPAIYNFERSLKLQPDRDDARFNLATARAQVSARVRDVVKGAAADPWWLRTVTKLTQRGWAAIFLVGWWLLFALLLGLRRAATGPARAALVAGTSLVALGVLLTGALLFGRMHVDDQMKQGIVLPVELAVREGPSATSKSTFAIHAGLRVRLLADDSGWVRVRLANGLEGWIARHAVGLL
jgi:hypothetical protein